MDGIKTWTGQYCYGVQRSIPYHWDGTFQNFVLELDEWEASLLDNVKRHIDIFTAIKIMEIKNLLWSPMVWLERLICHLVGNKYFGREDHSGTC
eukprot:4122769-Ditylum_brightwellii.AAC.1